MHDKTPTLGYHFLLMPAIHLLYAPLSSYFMSLYKIHRERERKKKEREREGEREREEEREREREGERERKRERSERKCMPPFS